MEVLWLTNMFDSRSTMKRGYRKDDIFCPHCKEGKELRKLENHQHLMSCEAYVEFRAYPEGPSCLPEKGGGEKEGARG